MTTKIKLQCPDGRTLALTHFKADNKSQRRFVIINSALGIKQQYYFQFATFLQSQGIEVLTWDPRGIGESSLKNPKVDDAKLREWGTHDLDAVLHYVVEQGLADWCDIHLIGHSAGGQLVGLCREIHRIKHLYLVCSGTGNWRLFSKAQWPRMFAAWYILVPSLLWLKGYIPARLGVGHDLPKGVAQDWRQWCLNKDYLFSDKSIKSHFYDAFEGKLHAFGFNDDVDFSPKRAIKDLVKRFTNASRSIVIYHPSQFEHQKIGHFGYFKLEDEQLWYETLVSRIKTN